MFDISALPHFFKITLIFVSIHIPVLISITILDFILNSISVPILISIFVPILISITVVILNHPPMTLDHHTSEQMSGSSFSNELTTPGFPVLGRISENVLLGFLLELNFVPVVV